MSDKNKNNSWFEMSELKNDSKNSINSVHYNLESNLEEEHNIEKDVILNSVLNILIINKAT